MGALLGFEGVPTNTQWILLRCIANGFMGGE